MLHYFEEKDGSLLFRENGESVMVTPWGANSFRVRAAFLGEIEEGSVALSAPQDPAQEGSISIEEQRASITNGKIRVELTVNPWGKALQITFYDQKGKVLLQEIPNGGALQKKARHFRPLAGGGYHLKASFVSDPEEKIYGMGQYQQETFDLKGCNLELAHRNSQASVPFYISSLGYGFLWHNAAIGEVHFGSNTTEWIAEDTRQLDYWITAGDTPAQIEEAYTAVTGRVPMMPEYGLGFWQCKLRYQTQEELLQVAREYKRRNLPIDVIVIDFFHWPKQGEWKFDPAYWPDPDAMVKELKELGIELMVSIWPTVDKTCENYEEMLEKGCLIRTERGFRVGLDFQGATIHFDATNPEARTYVWNKVKENYYSKGIRIFWLDEAEPEYSVYDFDNYRYYRGTNLGIGNLYPVDYARTFYEGMEREGQEQIVNLLRCAWAGSQKYGALVWSGDIASSFESMRNQLSAGLSMGIAGIPWWTTDIGGFHGGDPNDPAFRELFIRWFEWGTFCPVMRLHGDREPRQPQYGTTGGASCCSGAANEVWSYGEEAYEICCKYLRLREEMRSYTRSLMTEAHEKGTPVMRTLFYMYPGDPVCWEVEDEYLYGPDYLVAPILYAGQTGRNVYLPAKEQWENLNSRERFEGGQWIETEAPLDVIPVFRRVR